MSIDEILLSLLKLIIVFSYFSSYLLLVFSFMVKWQMRQHECELQSHVKKVLWRFSSWAYWCYKNLKPVAYFYWWWREDSRYTACSTINLAWILVILKACFDVEGKSEKEWNQDLIILLLHRGQIFSTIHSSGGFYVTYIVCICVLLLWLHRKKYNLQ